MEPIPALEVKDLRFDETVDVVVVGLGAAGSSAVVAARQTGADVLAVERGAGPGGTSANSGGLIYLGGGTALQRACGFRIRGRTWRHSSGPPLGRAWTTIAWTPTVTVHPISSTGWSRSACRSGRPSATSRTVNRPMTPGCSSAAVRTPIHLTKLRSRSRGHKPQCIDSAGGFLMERLGAAVATSGARVVADARAEALVVDGGDVVGVRVSTDHGPRAIRAGAG